MRHREIALLMALAWGAACSSTPVVSTRVDSGLPAPKDASTPVDDADAGDAARDAHLDAPPPACEAPWPAVGSPPASPPFAGTAYLAAGVLDERDPSAFDGASYVGIEPRRLFDRRIDRFAVVDVHRFVVRFGPERLVEFQINVEMTRAEAETELALFGAALGRLPANVLDGIESVGTHRGNQLFGGSSGTLLVHTDQGHALAAAGWLEEVLLHEAAHATLDATHSSAPRWHEAMRADGAPVSDYARDFPEREDVAESFGAWFALRHAGARLDLATATAVASTVPNRLRYFDCLGLASAR